ncbi:hypothetical protein G5V57_01690 [Nordella sp. HKS 07]|uniref:hypothetical protein n=1 Tax=Nordella sp. HKS 07 TaxID=2712222 RepID=UPI0013E0ED85|nr:hypothetical protein [Nordella sp. HKS 07]QIG46581.1 hypothetical protein G5V57_01690 [Nordella sp. HKS 07]
MRGLISRRSFALLAASLALASERAFSQGKPDLIDNETLSQITARLTGAAQELLPRFADRSESGWIKQLGDDISRLVGYLPKFEVSKFYGEMLDYDAATLRKAATEEDMDKATDYIRISHEDIKIKLWGIEFQLQRGETSTDVAVEVNTITSYDRKPVNGLYIQFYMLGTGDSIPPFRVFPKLTTPTQDFMPPGYYIIHVRTAKDALVIKNRCTLLGRQPVERIEIGIP